jgi:hypothetical protein
MNLIYHLKIMGNCVMGTMEEAALVLKGGGIRREKRLFTQPHELHRGSANEPED